MHCLSLSSTWLINIRSALLGLIHISVHHSLSLCLCLQVSAVRGAQCCSREGVKGELTWTERSRAGINELEQERYDMTLYIGICMNV